MPAYRHAAVLGTVEAPQPASYVVSMRSAVKKQMEATGKSLNRHLADIEAAAKK
jgi:hypothetical protein